LKSALTVAGSDSGGGAGIQADLKSFAAVGVYGTSVITALTAQNTMGVSGILDVPPAFVEAQFDAIAEDMGMDAMKTGMLFSAAIIDAVCGRIQRYGVSKVVVDPVMVATSGDLLLREDAVEAVKSRLMRLALVVTPNRREAEVLAGMRVETDDEVREAAERIARMGARYVLIKGGHTEGDTVVDWLFDGGNMTAYPSPRIDTKNTHGTGCTLSAAIAGYLALGMDVPDAVGRSREYMTSALRNAYPVGKGHGPVNHLFALHPGPAAEEDRDDAVISPP
jgi:hydroxymethylpyrimidine/phosphomethylpyrimidine kinase